MAPVGVGWVRQWTPSRIAMTDKDLRRENDRLREIVPLPPAVQPSK